MRHWDGVKIDIKFKKKTQLSYRSYGVTVSTHDSESCDPGSNPGRTFFLSGDKTRSDKKKVVKFFVRVLACE